jgi:D-alanyl-D-alanine carboxypeptidase/D-alanyl-D-alanine-endopeptidase (penicillin-binding protein 4)
VRSCRPMRGPMSKGRRPALTRAVRRLHPGCLVLPCPRRARRDLPPEVAAPCSARACREAMVAVSIHDLGSGPQRAVTGAQAGGEPGVAGQADHHRRRARPAGAGLDLVHAGVGAGQLRDGVLDGNLHIKGSGDPKLVVERLWLLLRRVQQMGVREIKGDIVLDGSAFAAAEGNAADFDGDRTGPTTCKRRSAAAELQVGGLHLRARPGARRGTRWLVDPPLAGLTAGPTVPLAAGPCDDWRTALKATFADGPHAFLPAVTPAAAASRPGRWPTPDAASYNARLIDGLWREMGGKARRQRARRAGARPARPASSSVSPAAAGGGARDQQVQQQRDGAAAVPHAGAEPPPGARPRRQAAREHLRRWLTQRLGDLPPEVVIDNGSGLSREDRVSRRSGWPAAACRPRQRVDAELMSSLPSPGRRHAAPGAGAQPAVRT